MSPSLTGAVSFLSVPTPHGFLGFQGIDKTQYYLSRRWFSYDQFICKAGIYGRSSILVNLLTPRIKQKEGKKHRNSHNT